ncbi:DMT family transporter [Neptunomonas antarctica]|uniref:Threonine/homoserine efflux transporter RhtA n=1 Tax=Neptunomonas antarctica TaxID=619304 RepID=A0A1N7NLB8_9GAMM|nr:DMT family transporter [Neptunomonas antarctica]SIS99166.1 Threonine/homoserine efflux transporter RhtA [Neptunomonas antarctica]
MAYLLLSLTTLFWAGNFVIGRAMHDVLPPVTMAQMRWSLALLIILPFLVPRLKKNWRVVLQNWKIMLVFGILSVGSFNTLIYVGLTMTGATNGTLLQSAIPIIILVITGTFLKESVSPRQWVGVICSLVGVLTLISVGDLSQLLSLDVNQGDLWILAATLCWSGYSICLRWRPVGLDGFTFFGVTVIIGVVVLLPFSLYELQSAQPIVWKSEALGAVLYMAIFPSILAHLFWNRGVAELGAAKAGLFIHLMPLFGMLLSTAFLGEQIHTYHLAGMVLIFMGIYLAVVSSAMKRTSKLS